MIGIESISRIPSMMGYGYIFFIFCIWKKEFECDISRSSMAQHMNLMSSDFLQFFNECGWESGLKIEVHSTD